MSFVYPELLIPHTLSSPQHLLVGLTDLALSQAQRVIPRFLRSFLAINRFTDS